MKKVFLLVIVALGLTLGILWLAKTKYHVPPPTTPTEKSTEQTKTRTPESITTNQQQVINHNKATMSDSKSERAPCNDRKLKEISYDKDKINRFAEFIPLSAGLTTSKMVNACPIAIDEHNVYVLR